MTRRTIAIVGGGIAGLTLAAALDPRRFEVVLAEAEPGRRVLGAGLGLWPRPQAELRRIGVGPIVPGGHDGVAGALRDLQGRPLVRAGTTGLLMVPRPRLMAALSAAVPPTVKVVARQVDDPRVLDADLVVGADGVRSRVRALVHPRAAQRLATPYVALRGTVASDAADAAGEYWGPGRLFGLVGMADGRGYWFTTHRSDLGPEPLCVTCVLAEAATRFADAAPVARATLGRALAAAETGDGGDTSATRLWLAPPMPRYARGRYVVIGDAAHASLPNLGRGACDAILDAVSLADALNRLPPTSGQGRRDRALLAWQARRLPATQVARVTASALMRFALLDTGHTVRDRVVGAVGRAALASTRHAG